MLSEKTKSLLRGLKENIDRVEKRIEELEEDVVNEDRPKIKELIRQSLKENREIKENLKQAYWDLDSDLKSL
jgi:superfamily II RNA helicase